MARKNKSKENKTPVQKKCAFCNSLANLTCVNCNGIHYCSKEHQKQHLEKHTIDCKPYIVKQNNVLGRYIVAVRDIKQGELILREAPTVVGPSIQTAPLCLNCYKPISSIKKPFACTQCHVAPFCSPLCKGVEHSKAECNQFKNNDMLTTENIMQHYQIVTPLRCLLLRETNPEKWKELIKMEAHIDQRRDTPIWKNYKNNVENILTYYGVVTEKNMKEELIQKICGILDVNTFELRIPGFEFVANNTNMDCLRGVYLNAALMAHDCIGNTHLSVDDKFNLIIHTSVPIPKDSLIYFNYTNAAQGTFERQEHLKEGKYFNCKCKRCSDNTECGTYMSSIICVKCRNGLVIPKLNNKDIYSHDTIWYCFSKKCDYKCRGSMINSAVNCAKDLIEYTDKTDIRNIESLIKKLSYTFAPFHSLILDLKQNLVGLYSQFLQREVNPNKKFLTRKLEICQELLPILEKVEPGISRLKGITLYEMHIPMVIIANRDYDNKEISAESLLEKLLEAETVLKKAISCLLYEPNISPEGRLNARALNELKLLRNSISSVQQIVANKKEAVDKRRKNKK